MNVPLTPNVIRSDAGKNHPADPVVVQKSLEATLALALAYQAVVIQHDEARRNQTQIVIQAEVKFHADDHEYREHGRIAQHHRGDVVVSEQDGRCPDADLEVVVAVHHRILRVVGEDPENI